MDFTAQTSSTQPKLNPMKLALLANWGIGLEVLRTLESRPEELEIALVVTKTRPLPGDPWRDAVARHAIARGHPMVGEEGLSLEGLSAMLAGKKIDLLVCHAYPRRLPRTVLSLPRLGCLNIHPSLLPRHRGPSPVAWALKDRDEKTGLTAHLMTEDFDAGPIVHQLSVATVGAKDVGDVLERLKGLVGALVLESLARIGNPLFTPRKQVEAMATYAPRVY